MVAGQKVEVPFAGGSAPGCPTIEGVAVLPAAHAWFGRAGGCLATAGLAPSGRQPKLPPRACGTLAASPRPQSAAEAARSGAGGGFAVGLCCGTQTSGIGRCPGSVAQWVFDTSIVAAAAKSGARFVVV